MTLGRLRGEGCVVEGDGGRRERMREMKEKECGDDTEGTRTNVGDDGGRCLQWMEYEGGGVCKRCVVIEVGREVEIQGTNAAYMWR